MLPQAEGSRMGASRPPISQLVQQRAARLNPVDVIR
jgi:hypothetical protein